MNTKKIEQIIHDNSLEYSSYVIRQRALPDLRDGMKPVYRRILYAMHKMKATKLTKSQNVEGQVMKYHPHAGSYPTMVGMVQEDNNITPFIVGKGNFGQHTSRDLQEGAPRYTEVKLSEISNDIFKGLNDGSVNWISNYDGTVKMPEVLPVKFPTILHQAQEGIAYGMASRIPSFGLNDICDAITKYISDGEKQILIPDFATGGEIIRDEASFKKINDLGEGSFKLRAKAEIIGSNISITEIPHNTTREVIIEDICKVVESKKIPEIKDVTDLTGLDNMEIEIECRKNADMNLVLAKLYKLTHMETSYSVNMNMIIDNMPKVAGVWEIIINWLEWRRSCIYKEYLDKYNKTMKEIKEIEALEKVSSISSEVALAVVESDMINVSDELIKRFGFENDVAVYISNIELKKLNKKYIEKRVIDKVRLLEESEYYNNIVIRDSLKDCKILEDLKIIKEKYGKERKTKVVNVDLKQIKAIKKESKKINNYPVTIHITNDGFIYKTTKDVEIKLTNDDEIIQTFKTENSGELVIFNKYKEAFKFKIESIKDYKTGDFGEYMSTIFKLDMDSIAGYTVVDNINKFIIILYSNGKVAKVSLDAFKTKTNVKALKNSLYADSDVVNVITFEEEGQYLLTNKKGIGQVKETKALMAKKTRNTQGVNVLKNIIEISRVECGLDIQESFLLD